MYDITNARSFENLDIWKQDFLVKSNPKNPDAFPFFVFGNKVDKANDRKVKNLIDVNLCFAFRYHCLRLKSGYVRMET